MIPIFNEHQYATDMNNGRSHNRKQNEKRYYTASELVIYTKWLYWNVFKDVVGQERVRRTQTALINFCNALQLHFNQDTDYKIIEYCIKHAVKEKLRTCKPCYITKREWNQLMLLSDENSRKMYFTCLVLAKFYRNNPIQIVDDNRVKVYKDQRLRLTQQSQKDLLRYAGIKIPKNIKASDALCEYSALMDIVQHGLIEPSFHYNQKQKKMKTVLILTEADIDVNPDDIYLTITDYNELQNYYNVGMHIKSYKICEKCGKAFKSSSKKNNDKYCRSCSGKDALDVYYRVCVDCGKRIELHGTSLRTIRCKECQCAHIKEYDRNRKNPIKG